MEKLTVIEIWWRGPYTMKSIEEKFNDPSTSYGLYQIYGTHNISGPNTLLYIGKADKRTFATRLKEHSYWTEWEASATEFYIGELGDIKNVSEKEWSHLIDIAERLLVYYCAPPYNTQFLNGYGDIHNTIILNLDKKSRLPLEVSTFYDDSEFWKEPSDWKEFRIK